VFEKAAIPAWLGLAGYIAFTLLGSFVIPLLFPQTSWYIILVAYLTVPLFAIPNSYMCGLTDWDMASTFGKLAIFVFSAWSARDNKDSGIIAGLATCGVVLAGTSQAATLMQDFKTGFLTCSSPVAMFMAQLLGTLAGCFVTPFAFFIFYNAFSVGDTAGPYPAPYAQIYRAMAILSTEGVTALPQHCVELCVLLFFLSLVLSAIRDTAEALKEGDAPAVAEWVLRLMSVPMAMAIPFYIGADLAIVMAIGSVFKWYWERKNKQEFDQYHVSLASGIIAGDGIWALPAAMLALAGVTQQSNSPFISVPA